MIFGEGPIIKNIAGDLNKLFLQGTRAGQPINNVEGDAAADQATIQLMADRDPVIRDISTGLGWAGREVTVSGTGALQLVNSLGRPLKSWSVELASYQEGSGDPSPENERPIHGTDKIVIYAAGKNIIPTEVPSNVTAGTFSNGDSAIRSATNARVCAVPVPKNTTLIAQKNTNDRTSCTFTLCDTGNISVGTEIYGYWGMTNATSTVINTGEHAWLIIGSARIDNLEYVFAEAELMISIGNTRVDYVPPITPTQSVITLPQTVYTGTVGSDGGESNDAIYDMGELNWVKSGSGDGRFYTGSLATKYAVGLFEFMCEQYKPDGAGTGNNYYGADDTIRHWLRNDSTSTAEFYVVDTRFNTAAEFKAAVTGIKIVCPAQNYSQFQITALDIPTPEYDGSIWVTAEDGIITSFSATYLQST